MGNNGAHMRYSLHAAHCGCFSAHRRGRGRVRQSPNISTPPSAKAAPKTVTSRLDTEGKEKELGGGKKEGFFHSVSSEVTYRSRVACDLGWVKPPVECGEEVADLAHVGTAQLVHCKAGFLDGQCAAAGGAEPLASGFADVSCVLQALCAVF